MSGLDQMLRLQKWTLDEKRRQATDLEALIERLRSDIRRFYALADAIVIPSLYDPFANVTVEALGMGLYVVSSKFNGGKEILDKECGCIIDDLFDPESVAKALEQSLFFPKTLESAEETRAKVSFMDFSISLPRLVEECLSDY